MKNFYELNRFLELATKEQQEHYISEQTGLLRAFALALVNWSFKDFQEIAESSSEYVDFLQKFYDQDVDQKLLFPSKKLLINLIKNQAPEDFIVKVLERSNLSNQEKLDLLLDLTGESSIDLTVHKDVFSYKFKNPHVENYSYLSKGFAIFRDNQIEKQEPLEFISMELRVVDGSLLAVPKNSKQDSSLSNKLKDGIVNFFKNK